MIFRTYIMVFIGAIVLAISPASAEETKFFSMLTDIPLMAGLYELPQDGMSFDKPEGRIVETAAASESKNANEIRAFYASTLPQLGWSMAGPDVFTREGEKLTMRLESQKALNIVHFSLSPAP